MVVGIAVGTIMTFFGCASKDNTTKNYTDQTRLIHNNEYIVVFENDGSTLHRGSYETESSDEFRSSIGSAVPILKFDCGEIVVTSQFISYIEKQPDETKYDHVCPDCFPNGLEAN